MHPDWIVDVLTDLKLYAENNDLNVLAEKLDHLTNVANSEISITRDDHSHQTKS